jgi:hypothetical protein
MKPLKSVKVTTSAFLQEVRNREQTPGLAGYVLVQKP